MAMVVSRWCGSGCGCDGGGVIVFGILFFM